MAPFEWLWETDEYDTGNYEITAKATDSNGLSATSTPVLVTVYRARPFLDIAVSGDVVEYGRPVTVTGVLTDAGTGEPMAGALVKLLARPWSTENWQPQGTIATDASGRASFEYRATGKTALMLAYVDSSGTSLKDSAARTVSVRPTLALSISPTRVRVGQVVRLSVTMSPQIAGLPVRFQDFYGGRWRDWTPVKMGSGPTTWTWKPSTARAYAIRVVYKADARFLFAESRTLRVTVTR